MAGMKTALSLSLLPSFQRYEFERAYIAAHTAEIAAATPDKPELREALNAAFRLAIAAEEKRIEDDRAKVAAANTAAFLSDPVAALEWIDEERGRTFDLGEALQYLGIATVTLKRGKGKGYQIGKGTLGAGTISPMVATVRIGDKVKAFEMGSRNDRHSKRDAATCAASQFALEIASNAGN